LREQAEREARMKQLLQRMGPPRRYRMMPDGTFEEIGDAEACPGRRPGLCKLPDPAAIRGVALTATGQHSSRA